MPKCPKCNEDIDTLIHIRSGSAEQKCWVDEEELNYDTYEFVEDNNVLEWLCSSCHEVLFTDEEEAIKFLKEKTK